jgi:hypothetical protein
MKPITELVRNLSKSHRDRIEKATKMAEAMIKTAEAAKKAAQKK